MWIVSRRPDDVEAAGGSADVKAGERIGKAPAAQVWNALRSGRVAIPGVGPFITAGVLASALGATGGAVAAGAIVGGTSGALAGAFAKAGYSKEEAEYLGSTIERGGVLVAVDADDVSAARLRSELTRLGGRAYGADRPTGRVEIGANQ
jgi:hypothetical protein